MTREEILTLSDEEFNKIYFELLQKLQLELKNLKKIDEKNGKKFSSHQENIYKFILGKMTKAYFNINGTNISLGKGNKKEGLKHILLRHCCEGCEGQIRARDILNVGNIIKNGNSLSKIETSKYTNKNNLTGFTQKKGDHYYKVILNDKGHINEIISTYSNKNR